MNRYLFEKCGCQKLIDAIDEYIAKQDKKLSDKLEEEGYRDTVRTVAVAAALEDDLANILRDQTKEARRIISNAGTVENAKKKVKEFISEDADTKEALQEVIEDYYSEEIPKLADTYIKQTDGELAVNQLRKRTSTWIEEWSSTLSDMMNLTSENKLGSILDKALEDGDSVATVTRKIMEAGIRNEEYQARRVALTEMLRAHSVAQQEAMMQDPSCEMKRWRHSGEAKIAPRSNHVNMDGQTVPKDKPYTLKGIKGGTFYPMYPHDTSLPPEESINCHCLSEPITNDLGLSLEERQKLQQEIIDNDDGEWMKELDAKNKAKAGIEEYEETKVFNGPSTNDQKYVPIETDENDKFSTQRFKPISATRVISAKNKIYVSDNAKIKRAAVHNIDSGITETLKKMNLSDSENLPNIVVLTDDEYATNAAAAYNAIDNVLYVRESAGSKKAMKAMQDTFTEPKNYISTYTHEMYHWADAQDYQKKYGEITNKKQNNKYVKLNRKSSKKIIEKLVEKGYDVGSISEYAKETLRNGKYEEVYTEYRVKQLLGE